MSERPTDFTYPNPPDDIPTPSLMGQVKGAWGLPWPRKPIGKSKTKGPPGKGRHKTTRSGVHKLGKKHLSVGGFY